MEWYHLVIIALALLVAFLYLKLYLLKRNIRLFKKELNSTKKESYNRQLSLNLSDRDIEALGSELNKNLDYQKKLKLSEAQSRKELERSISDIAHDLRTPLTVVKGNLQMLEKEELSDKGREYLSSAIRRSDALKDMVDEFFELSVLESDDRIPELTNLDITAFLTEFIIDNEALIRKHGLTPRFSFPERAITIKANKEMFSRVFSNLLNNIFKYAKDEFSISIYEKDGCTRITVSNPVSQKEQIDTAHIFDRTYRADKARKSGSAGLGLYIVKMLIEKQGGKIKAEFSENDNLTFEILFGDF
ncbi:MAG: HAMP domain-containing histidine kinase [Lachnospiraceae bacterium]|nr:HAMP domain-containing histidine kinase [Lachnospiraceae bacterium]